MKKILIALLIPFFAIVLSCQSPLTETTGHRAAHSECVTRDPNEECDTPIIDSLHTGLDSIPRHSLVFVCVYGTNIEGGQLYIDDAPANSWPSDGSCGPMISVARESNSDQAFYVRINGRQSNTMYLNRY